MPWKVKSHSSPAPKVDRRPGARARGYDAEWERVRAAHLRDHPDCRRCGQPGQHVDHIIPLARGGTHDPANLQTLCHSCHSMKTVALDGGFGRTRR